LGWGEGLSPHVHWRHYPNSGTQILICVLTFALATLKVCAQNADDFFHTGAQAYLTNNTAIAREQVDKGLKLYPNDDKLKKLDQLLKQQKQQQQQQQQQKNQQQQNQSQQNQSQSKEDQQKKKDQDKKDEQKKQDQEKKDQQKQDQQPDQKPDKNDDQQPPKNQPTPGEMSPDEAKKLLDSQKGEEKLLPANQNKQGDRRHLKDW
jgi:Ca-activated chloride channel family protein